MTKILTGSLVVLKRIGIGFIFVQYGLECHFAVKLRSKISRIKLLKKFASWTDTQSLSHEISSNQIVRYIFFWLRKINGNFLRQFHDQIFMRLGQNLHSKCARIFPNDFIKSCRNIFSLKI